MTFVNDVADTFVNRYTELGRSKTLSFLNELNVKPPVRWTPFGSGRS